MGLGYLGRVLEGVLEGFGALSRVLYGLEASYRALDGLCGVLQRVYLELVYRSCIGAAVV